jgi:hypothetical protein
MMLLAAISSLAFVFAIFVLFAWHSPLEVRIALAGIYFLAGTVATLGVNVLLRFDALLEDRRRRS